MPHIGERAWERTTEQDRALTRAEKLRFNKRRYAARLWLKKNDPDRLPAMLAKWEEEKRQRKLMYQPRVWDYSCSICNRPFSRVRPMHSLTIRLCPVCAHELSNRDRRARYNRDREKLLAYQREYDKTRTDKSHGRTKDADRQVTEPPARLGREPTVVWSPPPKKYP